MEYVSNSLKSRKGIEDEKSEEKQLPDNHKLDLGMSGIQIKKKSTFSKFKDGFIESSWDDVKESLIFDYLLPAAKNTIVDCFQSAIEMIFYGTTGRPIGRSSSGKKFTPYNSLFDRNPSNKISTSNKMHKEKVIGGYSMYEIVAPNRLAAERVIASLVRELDMYDMVSVAQLYEAASDEDDGITYKTTITDHKYGWYDINNYSIKPERGGYYSITLPEPVPLDL